MLIIFSTRQSEVAYTQSSARHAGTLWGLAWLGDMDALERMAKDKPSDVAAVINAYTLGCTPLHAAIQRNHQEVVKFLLANGADPDLMTEHGLCPLDIAIFAGDLDLATTLLAHQASVNRSDKNGNTLAMLAASNGDFDILCVLVDKGASTNRCNNKGRDTEDVLHIVHGKTLVQALSEGASMRAQKSTDQRALRYIESAWGSIGDGFETLLPVADAEALVQESGIRGHNAGLWQQALVEASHVHRGKTLVQASSEVATMQAHKSTDQRALQDNEAGWGSIDDGVETLSPVAECNAESWQQTMAEASALVEASDVTHEKKSDPARSTSPEASGGRISFEQFLSSYHRFLRSKTNFSPPSDEGGVDDSFHADDPNDFTSVIKTFEKGDATTLPISQELMDYTNKKIESAYHGKSSNALRLIWGPPKPDDTNKPEEPVNINIVRLFDVKMVFGGILYSYQLAQIIFALQGET